MKPLLDASRILVLLITGLVAAAPAKAQSGDDQSLSPYFFVSSEDAGLDSFPLKSTSVSANIAGVIADVQVSQTYANSGTTPIEAIYVFPGSTRAAVYGMKMIIGDRVRIAKIKERQQAKAVYEQAKKEGKGASLLEQDRPNVFKMSVANIMPGDVVTVQLNYTESLIPTDGVYEFVYPTVVGPRYSNKKSATAPASDGFLKTPYLKRGEAIPSSFELALSINSGLPLQNVESKSHKIVVSRPDSDTADITLDPAETTPANRDLIVRYSLQGNQIQSGLLLFEGEDENFFLLQMQPPKRVSLEQMPPREYLFVIDVSGSMNGFPLDTAKELAGGLLGNLRDEDSFNILLFAGGSKVLFAKSQVASADNISRAMQLIADQSGGGSSELLPALTHAFNLPHDDKTSRTIMIITDGYVAVEDEAFNLVRKSLGNANVFAFGIGSSVNRHLIEGLARAGSGEPFIVTKPSEAGMAAMKFREYVASPTLTNITVNYLDFDVYDVEPIAVPDLFAERPVVIFGKWHGKPRGGIALHGLQNSLEYVENIEVEKVTPQSSNAALRYLWARQRIATLSDYQNPAHKGEITSLGLRYNLLTAHTSFVAVDEVVRNPEPAQSTEVKQPLPLPQGVPNSAVGGELATVPEPDTYALMLIAALALFGVIRRRRLALGA